MGWAILMLPASPSMKTQAAHTKIHVALKEKLKDAKN